MGRRIFRFIPEIVDVASVVPKFKNKDDLVEMLQRRDRELEDYLNTGAVVALLHTFGMYDTPLTTGITVDMPAPVDFVLTEAVFSATTAGSADAEIEIFADGVSAGTLILPDTFTEAVGNISGTVQAGSGKVSIEVTNAGSGVLGAAALVLGQRRL